MTSTSRSASDPVSSNPDALSDREQILALHPRYGRANDNRDASLIATVFTDDVSVRYNPIPGDTFGITINGLTEFIEFQARAMEHMDCLHQFTNFECEIDGSDGSYMCLGYAQHWPRASDFTGHVPLYTVGMRYEAQVRRTADGWRTSQLVGTPVWASGDNVVMNHTKSL